jgi:hypothetical protein
LTALRVPEFARSFPKDETLDALLSAYLRGDFARASKGGAELARSGATEDLRTAAAELVARTRPDPLSYLFFGLAAALLVFLSIYWWLSAHAVGA